MTAVDQPELAQPAPADVPAGRLGRLRPYATHLRVAGGVLTIIGTYLPWATFVLNEGPYPDKATLEFFSAPLAVTGFRLNLLVFGIAAIVVALVPAIDGRARIQRGIGWGIVAVSVVNGTYIAVEGGGLGAITVSDGAFA